MRTLFTCKYHVVIEKAQADEFTTSPGPKYALLSIITAGYAVLETGSFAAGSRWA
jgi:hypothetical protein